MSVHESYDHSHELNFAKDPGSIPSRRLGQNFVERSLGEERTDVMTLGGGSKEDRGVSLGSMNILVKGQNSGA